MFYLLTYLTHVHTPQHVDLNILQTYSHAHTQRVVLNIPMRSTPTAELRITQSNHSLMTA